MGLFNDRRVTDNGKTVVPTWFMRQAGRYHKHYQGIRRENDFMTMCKTPEMACEITMGPMRDFDFDAAILFSDLLFPLEQLNMGLNYNDGPPKLERHLESLEDLNEIFVTRDSNLFYDFQKSALELLKKELPEHKTLLGFVGAPFTLYTYACEGAHKGNLISSKRGLYDGRYDRFMDALLPELENNMKIQASADPDAICLFDTAAGELSLKDYKEFVLPTLKVLTRRFKNLFPNKKLLYYSKCTNLSYLREIEDDNIDILGIDWRVNLSDAIKELGKDYYVQGNIDPVWLHLPWERLEKNLEHFWEHISNADLNLSKWICGLGHGVLPKTPEENVRKMVEYIHKNFNY